MQRSYSFSSSDVTGKPIDTSEAAPGVAFDAEMYPVAYMGRTGSLANLGIAIDYGRSFGATVPTVGTATAQVVQSRYEVGLRYRWVIGASPAPPTLTFGLGFGKRLFSPDRSGIADPAVLDALGRNAPNTNYEIVDPGATLRWPVSPRIALSLGASGLVVLDSGGIQSASSYGGGRVFGAELVAGAEVMLGRRFVVRVAADFVQIGFAFDGTGARSNGLDGNAATEEVSGLTDRAIGGSATLGVVY